MPTVYNTKEKIIEHYDVASPYYYLFWGEHLHHGYWVTGRESKEEAQVALIEHLAQAANLKKGNRILDVGCGYGGSSIYLAKNYEAKTDGITISQVQVDMAKQAAALVNADSNFYLMDAQNITLQEHYDVIWSIESISHYQDKSAFFSKASSLLKPGSTFAIIDWFKKDGLTTEQEKKFIEPIEKGMLVGLKTMSGYKEMFELNGLRVLKTEDISNNCAKTWDISLDVIKDKALWEFAMKHGSDFINFLKSFRAMKAGFASGNFVYGLIIASKE